MYQIKFSIYDDMSVEVETLNATKGHSFKSLGKFIKCLNSTKNNWFKSLLECGHINIHVYDYSSMYNRYVTEQLEYFLENYVPDSCVKLNY